MLVISSSNGLCTQNPATDVKLMYSFSVESRRSDHVEHDGYGTAGLTDQPPSVNLHNLAGPRLYVAQRGHSGISDQTRQSWSNITQMSQMFA